MPAVGFRGGDDGLLASQDASGTYWSSSVVDSSRGRDMWFNNTGNYPNPGGAFKNRTLSIRCVRKSKE